MRTSAASAARHALRARLDRRTRAMTATPGTGAGTSHRTAAGGRRGAAHRPAGGADQEIDALRRNRQRERSGWTFVGAPERERPRAEREPDHEGDQEVERELLPDVHGDSRDEGEAGNQLSGDARRAGRVSGEEQRGEEPDPQEADSQA